jgi:hypothetical protein
VNLLLLLEGRMKVSFRRVFLKLGGYQFYLWQLWYAIERQAAGVEPLY